MPYSLQTKIQSKLNQLLKEQSGLIQQAQALPPLLPGVAPEAPRPDIVLWINHDVWRAGALLLVETAKLAWLEPYCAILGLHGCYLWQDQHLLWVPPQRQKQCLEALGTPPWHQSTMPVAQGHQLLMGLQPGCLAALQKEHLTSALLSHIIWHCGLQACQRKPEALSDVESTHAALTPNSPDQSFIAILTGTLTALAAKGKLPQPQPPEELVRHLYTVGQQLLPTCLQRSMEAVWPKAPPQLRASQTAALHRCWQRLFQLQQMAPHVAWWEVTANLFTPLCRLSTPEKTFPAVCHTPMAIAGRTWLELPATEPVYEWHAPEVLLWLQLWRHLAGTPLATYQTCSLTQLPIARASYITAYLQHQETGDAELETELRHKGPGATKLPPRAPRWLLQAAYILASCSRASHMELLLPATALQLPWISYLYPLLQNGGLYKVKRESACWVELFMNGNSTPEQVILQSPFGLRRLAAEHSHQRLPLCLLYGLALPECLWQLWLKTPASDALPLPADRLLQQEHAWKLWQISFSQPASCQPKWLRQALEAGFPPVASLHSWHVTPKDSNRIWAPFTPVAPKPAAPSNKAAKTLEEKLTATPIKRFPEDYRYQYPLPEDTAYQIEGILQLEEPFLNLLPLVELETGARHTVQGYFLGWALLLASYGGKRRIWLPADTTLLEAPLKAHQTHIAARYCDLLHTAYTIYHEPWQAQQQLQRLWQKHKRPPAELWSDTGNYPQAPRSAYVPS